MMGRVVEFEGPRDAHIYIVGEAPGSTEEIEGKPFVGGAGRLLNRLLMESGLVRGECRIGNVMRVRPPNNDFSYFYIDRQRKIPKPELLEGIRYLKEDIKKQTFLQDKYLQQPKPKIPPSKSEGISSSAISKPINT
jgi:uracil-DNA glycosylase family 4